MPKRDPVSVYLVKTGSVKLEYIDDTKNGIVEAPSLISNAFKDAYNNQDTDPDVSFTIKIDGNETKVNVHSIILRQSSPVLCEILENNSNWNFVFEELFPTLNPLCFLQLLKYMYKGGLRFPKENLQLELLEAAKALKMEECQGAVRAWFASYLTPEEAIRIAPIALKKGHIQTFDICCTIISTVASSLLDYHPHILLNSELPMLIHFVKSSYYDVSENALFKLVTDYCERNAEKYGSDPKTFFKTHFENLIRYPLMKPEEIYSNFNSTNYYSSWVDRKFILEAYKFNALGRVYRDGLSTLRTIPRENISTIKWQAPSTCKNMLKFEKNKVTKISGGNYWNCVAYIPLKRSKYITVKIDFTNNDRSGLAIGIGGIDLIDKLSSYSDIVSTQYNMPSGATLGNPPIGSKIGYIVDYSKNEIRVIENGIDVGASHKKPSIFGKDLVLIAFLYYEQNSVSIIKNPRKKK